MADLNALGQPVGEAVDFTPPALLSPGALAGDWVSLSKITRTDLPLLFEAFAEDTSGANWTYLPSGPFAEYRAFEETFAALMDDTSLIPMVMRANDQVTGMACFMRMVPGIGAVEIGYVHFSPRMQRMPASTQALFLMADHAFQQGYRRLEWKCDALNAPSRACATRLGFRFEGIFRQDRIVKGRNRDTAWFSIIDADWPGIRAEIIRWLSPNNFDANGVQKTKLKVRT